MAKYYPKSQIKTNLYTNGDEFNIIGSNTSYIGEYYSTSTGRFYTGKNPNAGQNQELIQFYQPLPLNELNTQNNSPDTAQALSKNIPGSTDTEWTGIINDDWNSNSINNKTYNSSDTSTRLVPPEINPSPPTIKERRKGKYVRYYVKNIINTSYYEISKETFEAMATSNLYANDLYEAIFLRFSIGEKYNSANHLNFISIELKRNWKGFSTLSTFRPSKNDLYTEGGEFLLPNRTSYIGYYHNMNNGNFMTGRYHGDGPEILLIPLKSNSSSSPSIPERSISSTPSSPSSGGGTSGGGGY